MIASLMSILLEAAMRALIAGLAVWATLRLLRVKNLPAEKAAWGLVLLAALAMPLLMRWQWLPAWASVKLPAAPWTRQQMAAPVAALPGPRVAAATENVQPVGEDAEEPIAATAAPSSDFRASLHTEAESASTAAPIAAQSASSPAGSSGTRLLAASWIFYLAICAGLLIRLVWGLAASLRLWMGANPVNLPTGRELPAPIRVRWSSRVASPVNIGSGILLPANYVEWDEEKLRVVLAHERSHIRQADFYLQLLTGFYAAFTWFSPLGWWLKHKLSELGEAISDRAGLSAATSPSAYAGLLLEFAALPRPTLNGVAMAHSKNLSHRIERLLNEPKFCLAFAGGRRAVAMLVLPVALVAATAIVRVQAAAPQQAEPSQPAITGQSNPQPAQVSNIGPAQTPEQIPSPQVAPAPGVPPEAAAPPAGQEPAPAAASAPAPPAQPAQPGGLQEPMPGMAPIPPVPPIHVDVHVPPMPLMPEIAYAGWGPCLANGDSYAIVGDPGSKPRFCGDWGDEGASDVDKARSQAHGNFLLFRHEGKLYIVDDPAIANQIEAMDKSREDLHDQMRTLAKQMRDAGQQARDAARNARETAKNIPAPDLSKEIAALDATAASLKDQQGGTVSREQLQQLQREISELQHRVIEAEFGANMKLFESNMAKFGEEQGKYGEQMGKLGAEMGQMARENHQEISSIIQESLQNGKARPVQ